MKNIHVLPTEKNSWLCIKDGELINANDGGCMLGYDPPRWLTQHIYITDDSEIKKRDWVICAGEVYQIIVTDVKCNDNFTFQTQYQSIFLNPKHCKKIILTTDQDLIKDGVQAIDDEFLEWFVKNPSCEYVEVISSLLRVNSFDWKTDYKIIIPKEEPKQETLEEAAERWNEKQTKLEFGKPHNAPNRIKAFIQGAKYQQQQMYSEEEVLDLFVGILDANKCFVTFKDIKEWFEQNKNK